jgi:hypothetical protein
MKSKAKEMVELAAAANVPVLEKANEWAKTVMPALLEEIRAAAGNGKLETWLVGRYLDVTSYQTAPDHGMDMVVALLEKDGFLTAFNYAEPGLRISWDPKRVSFGEDVTPAAPGSLQRIADALEIEDHGERTTNGALADIDISLDRIACALEKIVNERFIVTDTRE